jgi:hypothetical protein
MSTLRQPLPPDDAAGAAAGQHGGKQTGTDNRQNVVELAPAGCGGGERASTMTQNGLDRAPIKRKLNGHRRAHRSADILSHVNCRTLAGKRTRELVLHYLDLLGNPSGLDIEIRILSASELQVLAEQARFAALEQTTVDAAVLDQIVRLESAAARAVRRLGLDQMKRKAAVPSLDQYLAAKGGNP